ncbi:MAG: lysostaphin resistance A-like protein [Promethearchaeota archaeon]
MFVEITRMNYEGKLIMTSLDMQTQSSDSTIIRFWQRIPIWIRAIVLAFIVTMIGVYAWLVTLVLIPAPWSIPVMGGVLWIYWKYFTGSWWPKSTAKARNKSFRAIKLSKPVWKWGLVAVVLFVVAVQSSFVLTFRIIEFPAETFTSGYSFDAMPLWLAWPYIIMSALVAGICEETGFRGYGQVALEEGYGPGVGITIVSILFLLVHLNQAWAPPVLVHIFAISVLLGILAYTSDSLIPCIIAHTVMDIFNFSYWWSDVLGKFENQPIALTGIDFHFITWFLIFAISIVLFFWSTRKTMAVRQQTNVNGS